MSVKSDILAILALRYIAATVFDILDRSIELPSETTAQQSLIGLIGLTMASWRRKTVEDEILAKGVEECTASDAQGEAAAMVREAFREHLREGTEQLETYVEMLAKMKEMLPNGGRRGLHRTRSLRIPKQGGQLLRAPSAE